MPTEGRTASIGVLVLALLVTGLGAVPDAHATSGTPVREVPVLSEDELVDWFESGQPSTICNDSSWEDGVWVCHEYVDYEFRAGDGSVTPRQLVRLYLEEGAREGITGDIAFMQGILETAWFFYPDSGQVRPSDNNFAGMGAFDSGEHTPFQFPDARTGVRAQMQHLRLYADPTTATDGSNLGSPLAEDIDDRYPDRWRTVRNITSDGEYVYAGQAPRWEDFGDGMWATDPNYASKILNVYDRALSFNDYPSDAATYSGRVCTPAVTAGGVAASSGTIRSLHPDRLLDTRNGTGGINSALGSRTTEELQVLGRGGVPDSNVDAVVVNITAVNATRTGYVTVWPGGTSRPPTSTLNPEPGTVTANEIIVPLGDDGTINLYNRNGTVDLIADVAGYVPTDSDYQPLFPDRLLDTRNGTGGIATPLDARRSCNLSVTGHDAIPDNASAAVLNITAVNATRTGYVTVWPGGTSRPPTSTLNPEPGTVTANEIIVPLGDDGTINLYNRNGTVDLIVDIVGFLE